jgi:hypothetical protein
MTPATDFAVGAVALALLALPGWMLLRSRPAAERCFWSVIAGALAWMWLLVLLSAAGLPLTRTSLGCSWTALLFAAALAARFRRAPEPPSAHAPTPQNRAKETLLGRRWWLWLAPATAVVAYRAIAQPLSGIDTVFRWEFLARQLLQHGTLAFYPPVSAADYALYGWPDGIAPLVASLYAGVYTLAGAARPTLTAPLVLAQFVLLAIAVHALARRLFSRSAAPLATVGLGLSAIVPWSVAIGQESGLLALAVVGLLLALHPEPRAATSDAFVLAGLAAALGALAREYALALLPLGFVLAARRLQLRAALGFALVALLVAGPWYARNLVRTGHPLFNLDLAGLFPVNTVHHWLQESFAIEHGLDRLPATGPLVFAANAGVLALAGLLAAVHLRRRALGIAFVGGAWIALWLGSIAYTAAGFTYALRVLAPALALAAILAGGAAAPALATRHRRGFRFGLALLAGDAALRALTLPANVYRVPPRDWLAIGNAVHAFHAEPVFARTAALADGKRILVLGPDALLTRLGARTLPLWSPEVAFLFDATLDPVACARRLRALGVGLVVLNRGPVNERFLARSAYFREPGDTLQPVFGTAEMVVLRVRE